MSQFSPPLTPAVISSNSSTPPSLTSPATALSTPHLDYIHDLQYDFYGRRLATCSGDSTLTIYSLSPSNTWLQNPGSTWQAHKGVVWSVSWAHPEYGQLIVSAGADHMVHVWEEQSSADSGGGKSKSGVKWVQKAQLTEARKAVNCVEFAPRHGGLRLAAGSADGVVRMYGREERAARLERGAARQECGAARQERGAERGALPPSLPPSLPHVCTHPPSVATRR